MAISFHLPIQSTSDVWCRRWCTMLMPMRSFWIMKKYSRENRSSVVVPTGNLWQYSCCILCKEYGRSDRKADLCIQ